MTQRQISQFYPLQSSLALGNPDVYIMLSDWSAEDQRVFRYCLDRLTISEIYLHTIPANGFSNVLRRMAQVIRMRKYRDIIAELVFKNS